MATDESSSSARTLAIHKEEFNVPLSGDEPNDLYNIMKHLKTFTGLAEIAKNKGFGEKTRGHDCHIVLFHHTDTKSCFSFAGTFKNTRKFKISIEGANLHLSLHYFCFVKIRLFNVFFWERKTGFGIVMKKTVRDARFS